MKDTPSLRFASSSFQSASSSSGVSWVGRILAKEKELKSQRLWLKLLQAIKVPTVSPII